MAEFGRKTVYDTVKNLIIDESLFLKDIKENVLLYVVSNSRLI